MLHYSSAHASQVFVGVAGWNYPQWRTLLEMEPPKHEGAELPYLRKLFNLVEITAAYYHPPAAKTVKAWLVEVASEKPFYFTVRLWNKLVRERTLILQNDLKLMQAMLQPLHEAEKLGALIVPVSSSLRYSESNELWLLTLLNAFAEFPLFVENLHVSWSKSDTLLRLQDRGVGVAGFDQANATNPAAFSQSATKRLAYLRCNGRAQEELGLDTNISREARYDYLYTEHELASLALQVKTLLPYLTNCFVVFNNYPRGNGLANALQLAHALSGTCVDIPQGLLQSFPILKNITSTATKQSDLFEESN